MSDLRDLISQEHSRNQMELIRDKVVSGSISIRELVDLFCSLEPMYAQRAAYVITGITDVNPKLLQPFLRELFETFQIKNVHQAIPRAISRHFSMIEIPSKLVGQFFELGLEYLISKKTPVAIKAHCMTALTNIVLKYPELKHEVVFAIQDQIKGNTAGYISRANKELKRLNKIQ